MFNLGLKKLQAQRGDSRSTKQSHFIQLKRCCQKIFKKLKIFYRRMQWAPLIVKNSGPYVLLKKSVAVQVSKKLLTLSLNYVTLRF